MVVVGRRCAKLNTQRNVCHSFRYPPLPGLERVLHDAPHRAGGDLGGQFNPRPSHAQKTQKSRGVPLGAAENGPKRGKQKGHFRLNLKLGVALNFLVHGCETKTEPWQMERRTKTLFNPTWPYLSNFEPHPNHSSNKHKS